MASSAQLARYKRRLAAIPKAVRLAVQPALMKSAQEIVDLAKQLCPVDDGDLRDSIGWTWGDAPEGTMVLATATDADLRITIYAGSNEAFYARWVEFGTTHSLPAPYFFPAYRMLKKRSGNRIKRAVRKAIRENWGK